MEETAGAGGLSGADKEQLREKLALLRWEYSETISRLRRARRAERARGHGQGAAAAAGQQEQSPAGSRDNVSPSVSTCETAQLQTKTCSDLDTEKAASVTFKNVPEFPSDEACQQDSLRAESKQAGWEDQCCGAIRDAPEQKTPRASRSWLKLRRRVKAPVSEKRESVRDEVVKNPVSGTGELRSPVFRRSSFSHSEEHTQRASRPAQGEENSSSPTSEASGAAQDAPGDSIPLGVPEPFPSVLWDPSHVWQPESPGAVAMAGNAEPAQVCLEKGDSPLLDSSGDGGKESSSIKKQSDSDCACEDKGEICRLFDLTSENEVLPADGNKPITDKGKSCEGDHSDTNGFNAFPTDLAVCNAGELLENQQLETESRLLHPEELTAPESALDSCTVVEGLLFPVEYYVRTTRRMSNCQRKVDLDAVILSQLGRSKKGQRSKGKQRDMNSDWPSQERVENDLGSRAVPCPFLGAENDSANASSPQKSLPASSGSSTSLGSVSQNDAAGTERDQRRPQRKQKGRKKSARTPSAHQVSQEGREGLGLMMRERSNLLPNECQSEKEVCEADLEKSSLEDRGFPAAGASGLGEMAVTGAEQPASADPPGGSQVLGKCWEALPEQAQNPLQNSDSLNPRSETFASRVGDLEANFSVRHADKRLAEHLKNQDVQESCRAEQLQAIKAPLRRSLRSSVRRRASQAAGDESKRARSDPVGSEGPAPLGLLAMDPDASSSLFSFRNLQWVAPTLGVQDFHLPDEEFGQLKLEKLESSHVNDLEDFVPQVFGDAVPSKDTWDVQMNPEENSLKSNLISPLKNGLPKAPHLESPASKRELSPHELLFTPVGTVPASAPTQPESQISSSIFPVVGATPAVLPPVRSEIFPSLPSVPPSQAIPPSSKGASSWVADNGEYKDAAIPLHVGSGGAGSARREEEQGTAFPVGAETGPDNKSGEAVALEKQQQSESEQQGTIRASPAQKKDAAEQSTPVLLNSLTEESLQLLSKLKDSSSSCAVDVSAVWWETAGSPELCVVTACESSVSLWKPLASNGWGKVYTWQFGEIPVIQIVPLPDTCNLVCIALGDLEIGEIRLLLYSSENDSFKQSLVRTGNIKAVLGLKDRRLVSSSRTVCEQQVEVVSLSETGRSRDGRTLMPPEDTVLAFAEVEGLRDALVGTTAVNDVIVWNLQTGQLLKKMQLGYSYPASICHRAYSDSGLLFVVLSHPHAKESESCGNPAFRVVVFNPKTARSTGVMSSSLPAGHAGRYLEGDVKDACAAAVLTSGAVAVWDLLLGRCTALLPPGPQGDWALARWATTTACLLAGQRDGTVCLYRYRQP
ncbi:partner and localizer of BRCA2 [Phaenicophaeus curvirostris]|uniref:partner and localizer of BRCA2 n=1 Tax=Phaenicophaeus curvirostris TaxID=33595 RepID=UPI0037F0E40F